MINREISNQIMSDFNKGKVIVILGARQVGKTTLLQNLVKDQDNLLMLNCDNYDDRADLENKTSTELKNLIGNNKIVIIDEAQRVKNIGLTLKIIADMKLPIQVLVTGSSSLEIASEIYETATGRLYEYHLFPLSLRELSEFHSLREEKRMLESRMVYGLYPEIVNNYSDAKRLLTNLANNYLYKDLFEFKGIKKPEILHKLIRSLALQLGNEVSYNELAQTLGIDKITVENYINLLEKCFVIFRLSSYSRNVRNEIRKGKKIYFYDNGIRNALISNFAPLELRNDTGALWENLMISERVKHNAYNRNYAQLFFWRTQQQQEIDLIEEQGGIITAYEFKWNERKRAALPSIFQKNYPNTEFKVINRDNYMEFL
jgi:predicted AAA+ superfamily ATPase